MEKRTMAANEIAPERRLGCQAQVLGDGVKVRIVNVFGFDAT
jgi:ferredoxin